MATLEHVNLTVSDPRATAKVLCTLFDWKIRWEGESMDSGYTLHVGDDETYLAVYASGKPGVADANERHLRAGLNHIGITVADIEQCEERVVSVGYVPFNHSNYDPGKRFYFLDSDNIEFEIVSYNS